MQVQMLSASHSTGVAKPKVPDGWMTTGPERLRAGMRRRPTQCLSSSVRRERKFTILQATESRALKGGTK